MIKLKKISDFVKLKPKHLNDVIKRVNILQNVTGEKIGVTVGPTGVHLRGKKGGGGGGVTGNLMAYYPFNGNAIDASGNGRDGSFEGGMDADNHAAFFDKVDDYVDLGTDFIGTGAVTFTCWYKTGGSGFGESSTIGGRFLDNGKLGIYGDAVAPVFGPNRISVTSDGGGTVKSSSNGSWLFDEWAWLCVTRTAAGVATIYINNTDVSSGGGTSGTPVAATTDLTLGNNAATTATFNGWLDDVRIYNKILTAAERSDVHAIRPHSIYLADEPISPLNLYRVTALNGGDGLYTCRKVSLDATNWGTTAGAKMIVNSLDTTNFTILNIEEYNSLSDDAASYVEPLAVDDLMLAYSIYDDEGNLRIVGISFKAGLHGANTRRAFCKTAAGAAATIVCFLDVDTNGVEITVNCDIAGGGNLIDAIPRLTDGFGLAVYNIGGTWYTHAAFQASEDCGCS